MSAVAEAALRRLSPAGRPPGHPHEVDLHIRALTLGQLANLALLRADDRVVAEVLAALKAGRPVFLHREEVQRALDLSSYPPRLREQFERWFSRIAGYGIALVAPPFSQAPPPAAEPVLGASSLPAAPPTTSPDRQILETILGAVEQEPHACVLEPGKPCCGSGRCKALGF